MLTQIRWRASTVNKRASKASFTLGAGALVTGHQHKIVLRSDAGSLSTQVQGGDLAPGHTYCARILEFNTWNKGVFTSVRFDIFINQ